ncbi:mannosyltransferase [Mycolicibacterium mucogenicum]|uniref:mannosyltransferase n=1 Tax=Mycolicibacterium mucogenicum TaxID=56689 RepID=UPI002269C52A|nr:mannosyltransferase [Mycolicibacterium mucogenicum]MCX8561849.1 mannosyltransferase [Mycolicibacterium mucogenicum]
MPNVKTQIDRHRWLAPVLLFLSAAALLAVSIPSPPNVVDLHVYVMGGAALEQPNTLYTFTYAGQSPMQGQTPTEPLPFIYPPFAAMLFYPLSLLPFAMTGILWQLAILAAVYGIVRISQLLIGSGNHREAMLWTAGLIWLEPVRVCLNMGQLGVFLTLSVLYAVYSKRWWISGLLVGLATGVKLTPAIAGFYFLGVRRWAAAVSAGLVFLATLAVSALAFPSETHFYFTGLIGRFAVPVGTAINQSWSGAIARILGHDAGHNALVLAAITATAVLAALAWRALGADAAPRDTLGSLLVVELFGLLASPISWVHHWIWLVPLILWLFCGCWRDKPGARPLGWTWVAITALGLPSALALAEPSVWQFSRPWYLAWAGLVYVVAAVVTFGWIAFTGRRLRPANVHAEEQAGTFARR